MKVSDRIAALEEQGYTVRFHHRRYAILNGGETSFATFPAHVIAAYEGMKISPRGGRTLCLIETPDGKTFAGEARCNPSDNFSKHEGRVKSLGRAVSSMISFGVRVAA
jgi:hypothetical protein